MFGNAATHRGLVELVAEPRRSNLQSVFAATSLKWNLAPRTAKFARAEFKERFATNESAPSAKILPKLFILAQR
jgi:hypothetical protein